MIITKSTHIHGNCLLAMDSISEVDMILADMPYGQTRNKWDSELPLDQVNDLIWRCLKPDGIVVLFGQGMFSAKLMMGIENYRYSLVWEKTQPSGFLNANRMPMRAHEDILVFYKKPGTYNPQKTFGHARKVSSREDAATTNYGAAGGASYDSTERYPRSVIKFAKDIQKSALHPTQKPVALCEWLIETYTNEGDLVLDFVSGSGTTGVAASNTDRSYILIENDEKYHRIGVDRCKNN